MKKLSITILAIALTFNLMATNVWDGSSEPWTQGDGTYDNPYRIETAAHLAYLAEKVNEGYQSSGQGVFVGERFLLTDDLDLNNLNWTPIGNVDYSMSGFYFAGYFDGGYHQIENLNIQSSADLTGLFAAVGGYQGCVCNLSVNGTVTSTGMGAAGVVGGVAGEGMVSQCSFSGSVSVTNSGTFCGAAGVVAGVQNGAVVECSSSASVTVTNSNFMGAAVAGGVVCFARGSATIGRCYNTGAVNASAMLMGISGGILAATVESAAVAVTDSYNVGQISGGTSGGIFGMVSPIDPSKAENEIHVTNCYFLTSAGGNNGYGTGMTADAMKTEEFKNQIDQSAHVFVMDDGTNNGYPIHALLGCVLMPASDVTSISAKLSAWIHQGNIQLERAYFYYSAIDAGEMTEIEVATDGYVEVVLEDLQEETGYQYGISLVFEDGSWMDSGLMFFTTEYDGVEEDGPSMGSGTLIIYPNPVSETLHIQCFELEEVQVFNALGQQVLSVQGKGNELSIDMAALPAGVYFVAVTNEDGRKCVRKVVKE
ncbi:MAG: T9SS type A sorting domain-containing protein [Bacteroidales bacterium]|nr:T9SS type A sorting domain-containing protein [Bacteroidales bacterium]